MESLRPNIKVSRVKKLISALGKSGPKEAEMRIRWTAGKDSCLVIRTAGTREGKQAGNGKAGASEVVAGLESVTA